MLRNNSTTCQSCHSAFSVENQKFFAKVSLFRFTTFGFSSKFRHSEEIRIFSAHATTACDTYTIEPDLLIRSCDQQDTIEPALLFKTFNITVTGAVVTSLEFSEHSKSLENSNFRNFAHFTCIFPIPRP